MNKNKFYEKVGKLTFSIILTGISVTALVYAASSFTNGQVLDAGDLNTALDSKLTTSDIPTCAAGEYLTANGGTLSCATPVDMDTDTNLTKSDVLDTLKTSCRICIVWSDRNKSLTETTGGDNDYGCSSFNSFYANIGTNGDVNGDDKFGVKVVCKGGTWGTATSASTPALCRVSGGSSKSGDCYEGDTHTYYGNSSGSCTYRDREGFTIPGQKYTKKYTQTCN